MLRVALVGCGKIADSHAAQILRIKNCAIVGVCDREPLMARQLFERFPIEQSFSDIDELLTVARPDVVHITTPPGSHFELAVRCLEAGCHVYVEKPFALSAEETRKVIAVANASGKKVTAGHDDQFSHVTRRMRALVRSGFLGGPPVHMEAYYCYEMGNSQYAKALLSDKRHWVRRLPGKLLHNIISHGIARIAEFLSSDAPQVLAMGFVSPALRSRGEREIVDELRVLIAEDSGMTASFTFSSQMRPGLHAFRLYGSRNGLALDQDQETLIKLSGKRRVSFAEKFVPPLTVSAQYLANWMTNMRTFLGRDFHMKAGMKFLIEAFYECIINDTQPPIPYREILLTATIMDQIFDQIGAAQPSFPYVVPLAQQGSH